MMRQFSVFLLCGSVLFGTPLLTSQPAFALSELTTDDGQATAGPIAPPNEAGPEPAPPSEGSAPSPSELPPLNDSPTPAPAGEPGPVETAPLPPPSAPGSDVAPPTEPAEPALPAPISDTAVPGSEASDTPLIEETPATKVELPATGVEEQPSPDHGPASHDDVAEPAPENAPLPPVSRDLSALPEPVARMRQLILDAARSGDVERLRPLLGMGERQTTLSLGGVEGDVIAFLKEVSGDEEGQEILAILSEVLEAGYVHFDEGEKTELYVWPYFFGRSLETLTPEQKVELFRIVTAGDYADMLQIGAYVFYRVGITPDGEWAFFVAGD